MIAQAEAEVVSADAEVARSQSDVERYRRLASDRAGTGSAMTRSLRPHGFLPSPVSSSFGAA
jgi:multidrug resistance efflux pump